MRIHAESFNEAIMGNVMRCNKYVHLPLSLRSVVVESCMKED